MPEILIVAGPNGAGKTSFANVFLRKTRDDLTFLNADEIARELSTPPLAPAQLDIRAGREMLERIEDTVAARASFSFETTLASLTYAQKIPYWRQLGYTVVLIIYGCQVSKYRFNVSARGFRRADTVFRSTCSSR